MPSPPTTIPTPRETSPLRVLAGIALVAVTICAVALTVLAWHGLTRLDDLDRVIDKADSTADDASRASRRLEESTSGLPAAVDDLRAADRALRDAQSQLP